MCISYFHNLFTSIQPSRGDIDMVLEFVQLRVTEEMSERLDMPFTSIEVRNAL